MPALFHNKAVLIGGAVQSRFGVPRTPLGHDGENFLRPCRGYNSVHKASNARGAEAIERQPSNDERNAVSAAYEFAEHLSERRQMMQAWADYLDALKTGGKVTPLFKVA